MLTSLRIQNFKCWRDTGEMRLAPITGLFGVNSSGKTSILQFLQILKQTAASPDNGRVLNSTGLGQFDGLVFRGAEQTNEERLEWAFSWKLPFRVPFIRSYGDFLHQQKNKRRIYFDDCRFHAIVSQTTREVKTPEQAVLSRLYADEFTYAFTSKDVNQDYSLSMRRDVVTGKYTLFFQPSDSDIVLWPDEPRPEKCYGFPSIIRLSELSEEVGFDLYYPNYLFEHLFANMIQLGPVRALPETSYAWTGNTPSDVGKQGQNFVEAILSARDYPEDDARREEPPLELSIANWLKRLGLVANFRVERDKPDSENYAILVQLSETSPFVPLTHVGFGLSQVLPVVTLCLYASPGSTLLLEQPELHLHPKVQAELADLFIEVAKNRNIQIILESHSEHLLTRLQLRMAQNGLNERGIAPEQVALYFCERPGAEAHLKPLDIDDYGNITNWPKDFFGDELGERAAMLEAEIERRQREAA